MLPQLTLIVAYMGLTHLAVVMHSDRLALAAVSILVLLALLAPMRRGALWPYAVLALALAGIAAVGAAPWARIVLFLPPVLINVGLAWVFGHTLLSGRTPLVERFIRALHSSDEVIDPAVWVYARSVTLCWTALFCFNATLCLLLAFIALPGGVLSLFGVEAPIHVPTMVWTLYSDIGCYVLTALLFIVEYGVRRKRFPWQPYASFVDFMKRAIAVSPAVFASIGRTPASVREARK